MTHIWEHDALDHQKMVLLAMSVFRIAESEDIPASVAAERMATRRLGVTDEARI